MKKKRLIATQSRNVRWHIMKLAELDELRCLLPRKGWQQCQTGKRNQSLPEKIHSPWPKSHRGKSCPIVNINLVWIIHYSTGSLNFGNVCHCTGNFNHRKSTLYRMNWFKPEKEMFKTGIHQISYWKQRASNRRWEMLRYCCTCYCCIGKAHRYRWGET